MTARLRLSMIDSAMESSWFTRDRYSLKDVHVEAFYLFIYGILTEKGRAKVLEIKQVQPL
jgi:hypothetical protein